MKKILIILTSLISILSFSVVPSVEIQPEKKKGIVQDYELFNTRLEKGKIKIVVTNLSEIPNLKTWYDKKKINNDLLLFDDTNYTFYIENKMNKTDNITYKIKFFDNDHKADAKYPTVNFTFANTPTIDNTKALNLKIDDKSDEEIKEQIKSEIQNLKDSYIVEFSEINKKVKTSVNITIKNEFDQEINLVRTISFELNFDVLNKLVNDYEKVKTTKTYNDPQKINEKNDYDTKIEEAKNFINNLSDNNTQQDVDSIVEKVNLSLNKLLQLDKAKLDELINKSEDLKKTKLYTKSDIDKKERYDRALENAKKLDVFNTNQTEINELTKELSDAENELNGKIDVSKILSLINEKNDILEYRVFEKLTSDQKNEYLDAIEKAGKLDLNNSSEEEINEKIKEIENIKEKLGINLEKNIKYLRAFSYDDTSILDSDKKIYFKLGGAYVDFIDKLTNYKPIDNISFKAQLGTMLSIKKVDNLKLGTFIEYDKKIAHNISLGFSYKYSFISGFIRYRLQEYNKKINHNIDLFTKYSNTFKINNNLDIKPNISIYLNYSPKLKLDDNSILDNRYSFNYAISSKFIYKLNSYNLILEPQFSIGFKKQGLISSKNNDTHYYDNKSDLAISLNLAFEKEIISNLILTLSNNLKIKNDSEIKNDIQLSLGYDF